MYIWSDDTPITPSNVLAKMSTQYPKFTPAYYAYIASGFWNDARRVMMPAISNEVYYFQPHLDFKWGYSVPTYANRIALCLDSVPGSTLETPHFDYHAEVKTTWKLWGYPNKNYNEGEKTLLGTFTTANFTRSVGTFKWNQLSWPSGARFTHYFWQPSTYVAVIERYRDISGNSCPPILGI